MASLAPLPLLALAAPAFAGQVWVVDDSGGAGIDFTEIAPAVAAAASGDVVLVREGAYAGFAVHGKELAVVADAGATPALFGSVSLGSTSAQQSIHLRGFSFIQAFLGISQAAGPVVVEDCQVEGGFLFDLTDPFGSGLVIHDSDAVVLRGSSFRGTTTIDPDFAVPSWGMRATNSTVFAYDCEFHAGALFSGDGALCTSAFLYASGCTFQGGAGQDGVDSPFGCIPGADGGAGVRLEDRSTGISLDVTALGGAGGAARASCPAGAAGSGFDVDLSTHTALNADAYSYSVESPGREGESVTVAHAGPADGVVFTLYSLEPTAFYLPDFLGALHLAGSIQVLADGGLGSSGELQYALPLPELLPAGQAVEVALQGVLVEAGSGAVRFGPVSVLTLLDGSL